MSGFFRGAAVVIAAALLAAGCESTGTAVADKEDMLADTGFVPKRANSASRVSALKSLPPHQFVMQTVNGKTRYVYADPTVCGCLYVGDQQAYDQYRQRMAARQTATDAQIRATLSSTPLPGEGGGF